MFTPHSSSWPSPGWMRESHKIGFQGIRAAHRSGAGRILSRITAPDASLRTEALGLTFPSPFGLAAGFDKEGHGIEALSELGFGHVEVGTITGQAQPGNEKPPRLFRLIEDKAVINAWDSTTTAPQQSRRDSSQHGLLCSGSTPTSGRLLG